MTGQVDYGEPFGAKAGVEPPSGIHQVAADIILTKGSVVEPGARVSWQPDFSSISDFMSYFSAGDDGNLVTMGACAKAVLEINKVYEEVSAGQPDFLYQVASHHTPRTDDKISEPDWLTEQLRGWFHVTIAPKKGMIAVARLLMDR